MLFVIKSRWSDDVLFSLETESLKLAVEEALLRRVDLTASDLRRADLTGATLMGANLRGAELMGADLTTAELTGADLMGANLTGAEMTAATLRGADLRGANLTRANLRRADLTGATLTGANLTDADLRRADLTDVDLTGANLSGAELTGADLTGETIRSAELTQIRDDIWAVLSSSPEEVRGLRVAITEGRIDGSTYEGACCCLVGTLANLQHCKYDAMLSLEPNARRPAERFFTAIQPGDTPENSPFSRLALEWVDLWLANRPSSRGLQ